MTRKNKQNNKKNYFQGKNDLVVKKKLAKAFILGLSDKDACYFADVNLCDLRKYEKDYPYLEKRKKELKKRLSLVQEKGNKWVKELQEKGQLYLNYSFAKEVDVDHLAKEYGRKVEEFNL